MVVADVEPQVLAHFVAADGLAHTQPNRILAFEPTGPASFDYLFQLTLGRLEQLLALAGPVLGQGRVLAHHQPLTRKPGGGDLDQIALVEQAQLEIATVDQGFDLNAAQG